MKKRQPRVVLLHAYDARNRGDGLLVAESLGLLARAGVEASACRVLAMHADSFAGLAPMVQYPGPETHGLERAKALATVGTLAGAGLVWPSLGRPSRVGALVRGADLVVGVGGAYLRAPGGRASVDTLAFHVPQLALAADAQVAAIYLPQSVGPLEGVVGRSIRRWLERLEWIGVRDDRSLSELKTKGVCVARRVPDLAVLAVARSLADGLTPSKGGRAVVIARELAGRHGYGERIRKLQAVLPAQWAVHSRALGQDDASFYASLGIEGAPSSQDVLGDPEAGVTVSVRLHGALQSILAGVPAIHLSYERKGAGAYGDLGITEWLHDANGFDPEAVAAQARALLADPAPYWDAVSEHLPQLLEADARLVDRVGAALE